MSESHEEGEQDQLQANTNEEARIDCDVGCRVVQRDGGKDFHTEPTTQKGSDGCGHAVAASKRVLGFGGASQASWSESRENAWGFDEW